MNSSNNGQQRTIYPFGDKTTTLNMDDFQIDCRKFSDQHTLEDTIRKQWYDKGLVVLTHTGMQHLSELQKWAEVIFDDFTTYEGGSAPRGKWSDKIFTLDDTPSYVDMCYHNEACYLPTYPQCFVLGSLDCPRESGSTLMSDNVVTTAAILETPLGQVLKEKGIRYNRNMTDKYANEAVFYKHWQDTFYTDSRDEVEKYLKSRGWDYEWLSNGTLHTSYVMDAFEYHERLDKNLYFAGLVSHAAFFDQWHPYNTIKDEERAFTMTLEDGTPFSDAEIKQLYAAYNQASLAIKWREADVALADNLRWSHARPAFSLEENEQRVMGVTVGMMKKRVGKK